MRCKCAAVGYFFAARKFCATAARMRSFRAASSILLPSLKSMAQPLASSPALKRCFDPSERRL
jgi:hypothetical protein